MKGTTGASLSDGTATVDTKGGLVGVKGSGGNLKSILTTLVSSTTIIASLLAASAETAAKLAANDPLAVSLATAQAQLTALTATINTTLK